MSGLSEILNQGIVEQIFTEDKAKAIRVAEAKFAETMQMRKEAHQDLKDLAISVLGSDDGQRLLSQLTDIFYLKRVYPPPAGQTAGEYAAQIEGSRNVIGFLHNLTKED